jgi:hypothetical protein
VAKLGDALGLVDDHVDYVCKRDHEDGGWSCQFCAGGLWACSVCDGFEGAMPTQCPGARMTADQSDAVYKGRLDFRAGRWWLGLHSRYAPGWSRTWEGMAELLAELPQAVRLEWLERFSAPDPDAVRGYVEYAATVLP